MVNAKAMIDSNQSCNQKIDSSVTSVKPIIEAIDTMLVSKITVRKIAKAIANIVGLYINSTPIDVATALPPLKPIHIEKVWPRMAPRPTTITVQTGAGPQM